MHERCVNAHEDPLHFVAALCHEIHLLLCRMRPEDPPEEGLGRHQGSHRVPVRAWLVKADERVRAGRHVCSFRSLSRVVSRNGAELAAGLQVLVEKLADTICMRGARRSGIQVARSGGAGRNKNLVVALPINHGPCVAAVPGRTHGLFEKFEPSTRGDLHPVANLANC